MSQWSISTKISSMPSSPARDVLVIADSGPLIALSGIRQLTLLPQLYQRIGAPPAVVAEILAACDPLRGRALIDEAPWLERLSAPTVARALPSTLGEGEAEAILLALGDSQALLLMDDLMARRAATALSIPVTGSAGVLVRAKRQGLVPAVRPLLLAMRGNGYYLSDVVIERAIRESGESSP